MAESKTNRKKFILLCVLTIAGVFLLPLAGVVVSWAILAIMPDHRPDLLQIIALPPVLNKVERTGPDWSRNILFKKEQHGDDMYDLIIKRIESSVIAKSAIKTSNISGNSFIFNDPDAAGYDRNSINMKCAFEWPGKEEFVIIYNGDNFVMVEDTKW